MNNRLAEKIYWAIPILYLVPWQPRIAGIGFNWFEIVLAGCIFIFSWRFDKLSLGLIVFSFIVVVSNLYGASNLGYPFNLKNFMFIKFLPVYLGAIILGKNLAPDFNIKKSALVSLFVLFVLSVVATFNNEVLLAVNNLYKVETVESNWRLSFIGGNPLGITSLSIIYLLILIDKDKNNLLIFVLSIIPIILAGSRAGIVMFVIIVFLLVFDRQKGNRRLVGAVILIAILFFITIFKVDDPLLKNRVERANSASLLRGIEDRIDVVAQSMIGFEASPILGLGYRQKYMYGETGGPGRIKYGRQSDSVAAHNQFIAVLINHGLIGLIILLVMLAIIYHKYNILKKLTLMKKTNIKNQRNNLIGLILFVYLISMLGWESLYNVIFTSFLFINIGILHGELKRYNYNL